MDQILKEWLNRDELQATGDPPEGTIGIPKCKPPCLPIVPKALSQFSPF
jgi:hypothetical protein